MSLQTRLSELIAAIGADIASLITTRGTMLNLTTAEKTNLVGAINELNAEIDSVAAGSVGIDDAATSSATTWSSQKISTQSAADISAAIDALVNGAPGALDTLVELANELTAQDTALDGLLVAVGNRLRFDAPQTLTAPQKVQGNANLGSASLVDTGNLDADLAALYVTAKA